MSTVNLTTIKANLQAANIFLSDEVTLNNPSVMGYEKKFRWFWFATQLNTFIVAGDFDDEKITPMVIEKYLDISFELAKKNHTGWPRGLQSARAVIVILISSNITEEAKDYCRKLKSAKKWAAFTIPIVLDRQTNEVFRFEKKPVWGLIYYPYFTRLINKIIK